MTTAYSYIRFSTKDQLKGDSERRQHEQAKAYCKNNKLELSDKSFKDLGISAFKDKERPSLDDMLTAIENGTIQKGDYILLENLDRLSRKGISHTQSVINSILNCHVNIVSIQENLKLTHESKDDLISIIRIAVSADLAHKESFKKQERLQSVWNSKQVLAQQDKVPKTSICPAWLELSEDRKEFIVIEEKVKIVRKIFSMAIKGVGKRRIAHILNVENTPHISDSKRSSGVWHPSYISKILKSQAVIGTLIPTKYQEGKRILDIANAVEKYYPSITDFAQFEAVQSILESNTHRSGRKGLKFSNLLQGLCFCRTCGHTMRYVNKNSKTDEQYLGCYRNSIGLCSNNTLFKYSFIEKAILNTLMTDFVKEILKINTPQPLENDKVNLNAELEITRQKIDSLMSLNVIDDQVSQKLTELSATKSNIQSKLNKISKQKSYVYLQEDVEKAWNRYVSDPKALSMEERTSLNLYLVNHFKLVFCHHSIGKKFKLVELFLKSTGKSELMKNRLFEMANLELYKTGIKVWDHGSDYDLPNCIYEYHI